MRTDEQKASENKARKKKREEPTTKDATCPLCRSFYPAGSIKVVVMESMSARRGCGGGCVGKRAPRGRKKALAFHEQAVREEEEGGQEGDTSTAPPFPLMLRAPPHAEEEEDPLAMMLLPSEVGEHERDDDRDDDRDDERDQCSYRLALPGGVEQGGASMPDLEEDAGGSGSGATASPLPVGEERVGTSDDDKHDHTKWRISRHVIDRLVGKGAAEWGVSLVTETSPRARNAATGSIEEALDGFTTYLRFGPNHFYVSDDLTAARRCAEHVGIPPAEPLPWEERPVAHLWMQVALVKCGGWRLGDVPRYVQPMLGLRADTLRDAYLATPSRFALPSWFPPPLANALAEEDCV